MLALFCFVAICKLLCVYAKCVLLHEDLIDCCSCCSSWS